MSKSISAGKLFQTFMTRSLKGDLADVVEFLLNILYWSPVVLKMVLVYIKPLSGVEQVSVKRTSLSHSRQWFNILIPTVAGGRSLVRVRPWNKKEELARQADRRWFTDWRADVQGTEVLLPKLNVEDTDRDNDGVDSSGQASRRPSKLTLEPGDETAELIASNVAEIAALAVQQLEPDVSDTQLAEVDSHASL